MNKIQDIKIPQKNIYAFIDPTAKGEDKKMFHLFVKGRSNEGFFMHNGKRHSLDELQNMENSIIYYTSSVEQYNIDGNKEFKNVHHKHISNRLVDILNSENFLIHGIEFHALEAIRTIVNDDYLTINQCRLYENLFTCVQKRNLGKNKKQTQLTDFCME